MLEIPWKITGMRNRMPVFFSLCKKNTGPGAMGTGTGRLLSVFDYLPKYLLYRPWNALP